MKWEKQIKILLIVATLWAVGIFIVQLNTLPQMREQVALGLKSGLQDIAQSIPKELSDRYEHQLKSELGLISSAENFHQNSLSALAAQWEDWTSSSVLGEAWFVIFPDSMHKNWKVLEHHKKSRYRDAGFTPSHSFAEIIQQKLSLSYDHWKFNAQDFWETRIDSTLLLYHQQNSFYPSINLACQPFFDEQTGKLIGFTGLQINNSSVQKEIISQYFKEKFYAQELKRKDGIRKAFLYVQVRDETGDIIYRSSLLAGGKTEAKIPIGETSQYLGLHQVEVGFLGKDSRSIATSLYKRNTWIVSGVFAVMLLLIGLIYFAFSKIQRLSRIKSDFLANISHELKTPLTAIRLANDTLLLGRIQTPEQAIRSSEIIQLEEKKLERLITTLLDFSQMEAGKRVYEMQVIEIATWWESWLPNCRKKVQHRGFSLTYEGGLPSGKISVDSSALEDVLGILIDNAIKYSGASRKIEIKSETDQQNWNISVTDFGIGIQIENQDLIFEKFIRLSDPEVHNIKGYGIGLSIAKSTMDAHGGIISVDSAPGEGSRFILSIPLISA